MNQRKLLLTGMALMSLLYSTYSVNAEGAQGEYIIESNVSWPSIEKSFEEENESNTSNPLGSELSSQIEEEVEVLKDHAENVSIYIQVGSERLSSDEDAIVQLDADGLIQLFITVAYYAQIETGALSGDEKYLLTEEDLIASGVLNNLPTNQSYTFKELIQLMLQSNDLSATQIMLNELGGPEKVTQLINDLGFLQTQIINQIDDEINEETTEFNKTSAADVANLLLAIYQEVLFDAEINQEALKMISQHGPTGLVSDLDVNNTYYGKLSSGFLPMMTNDAVLFEMSNGQPFVIVVMAKSLNQETFSINQFGHSIFNLVEGSSAE